LSARVVAWVALLSICFVVVVGAYCIISSSLTFFQGEASKVVGQLGDAPQLRSAVEDALRFATSFIWMVFMLLILTLMTSLLILLLESLIVR
jgi:energy-coupling factor transporter transmembrane protein EcfT